ncbi:phosphatase PAP2 family protein [Oleiagrimonas sp. C23AA]|uniref:phosphatase PAP2 family protein n=1 Tax=Oleiagrimonas sp. C23AA TaxID=2719047 RepID=UPI0014230837|nr:phosphatase PAP2 family protein [Oleiagrimonas sp. C23AA]NII10182.1 phosphatase PAP2 family protein [Oleiagrimonas sp. C23AA]
MKAVLTPRAALEQRLCLTANRWGTRRAIGRFFAIVSRLGDGVFWYALMGVIAALGGWRGLQAAAHMALTGLAALGLYRLLKRWTRRPRPFRACPGVIAHIPPLDEFSFPSGHTLQAVGFTLVALAYYPMLAPLLVPFTLLVAASRVVLGLHYPSDVLAAGAIGTALASLSLFAINGVTLLG